MIRAKINFKILFFTLIISSSYTYSQNPVVLNVSDVNLLNAKELRQSLEYTATESFKNLNLKINEIREQLYVKYTKDLETVVKELNSLRNPYYQYQVYLAAKKLEGTNLYHDYGFNGKNDDSNTCVNGWCQVMSETSVPQLRALTKGLITFYPKTVEEERKKDKPNLWQKKPVYINVKELIDNAESLGFLPIDLDLAQRGDFCIQYYRKQRIKDEFAPQHISIIDQIIPWGNGTFELRDWHEGIEEQPFVYRTGSNMKSSFNNIFHPQNVYYGYQADRGRERKLYTSNPNVCQAYGYFGENMDKARTLIAQIIYLRGQMAFLEQTKLDQMQQLLSKQSE